MIFLLCLLRNFQHFLQVRRGLEESGQKGAGGVQEVSSSALGSDSWTSVSTRMLNIFISSYANYSIEPLCFFPSRQ